MQEKAIPNSNNEMREFDFTKGDFDRVCRLIYEHAGISLAATKRKMVYSRFARRLRATGLGNFKDYLALLAGKRQGRMGGVHQFAHHQPHFFFSRRAPLSDAHRACQEIQGRADPALVLRGLDRRGAVLDGGHHGGGVRHAAPAGKDSRHRCRYQCAGHGTGRGVSDGAAGKNSRGTSAALFPARHRRAREELGSLITFRPLNLLDAGWPVRGPFHAIFCRNVMIYFDKTTQYGVLRKFAPLPCVPTA